VSALATTAPFRSSCRTMSFVVSVASAATSTDLTLSVGATIHGPFVSQEPSGPATAPWKTPTGSDMA
jgi:hypothetical protein